jgi:hypothetical protein
MDSDRRGANLGGYNVAGEVGTSFAGFTTYIQNGNFKLAGELIWIYNAK